MKNILSLILILSISFFTTKAQDFTELSTAIIQVKYSSIAWGDIDNDGDGDLFICGEDSEANSFSKIYENTGDDNFTELTTVAFAALSIGAAEWGDYNNDGFIDLLVQGYDGHSGTVHIYKNNGDKTFTALAQSFPPVFSGSVSWADFNNDSLLDFALVGFEDANPWNNVCLLYKNNGDDTFTALSGTDFPATTFGKLKWADYDNDGFLDFVTTGYADDFFTIIYRNNGNETFSDSGIELHQGWLGDVEWGDYNNDGNVDLVVSGTGGNGVERYTILYTNDGSGHFTATADAFPGVSHSSLEWADFDNDGDLDLYISGTPGTPGIGDYVSAIYLNDNGSFSLGASFAPNYWGEVRAYDYNNDNFPDLAISGFDNDDNVFAGIYKNIPTVDVKTIPPKNTFKINPIPANNHLTIKDENTITKISIISIAGKEIATFTPKSSSFTINTESFNSGVYLLKWQTKNNEMSKKIVITH